MNATKYLAGISIVGLVLILGLSANVSAIPYISIGNTTNNFTVVPGQDAEITLPIMVKNINVSNASEKIKGLQFNVTFNCSAINITNITQVDIVNVPSVSQKTERYNELCNGSSLLSLGILKAFCFFMNTTLTNDDRTNASILFATVINNTLGNDICVLRMAFASYKELNEDVVIGKIKMRVKGMPNYFNTNFTLPMNITIEKMGLNKSVNINVTDANIHSQARSNGLIKACRGNLYSTDDSIDLLDRMMMIKATLPSTNPNYVPYSIDLECIDLYYDGSIDLLDRMMMIKATLSSGNPNYMNLSTVVY